MNTEIPLGEPTEQRWRPLSAIQRRVAGVLVEKAKTTPDAYPLTLNSLTNGCNQKSNRAPHMDLSTEDVERAVEELRELGALAEVQSGGRVAKFRHYLYEWLGVDKVELAVMAELLLRGEQTVGELRGHAAHGTDRRSQRIAYHSGIPGSQTAGRLPHACRRGQVMTHNLYSTERLEELKKQYATGRPAADLDAPQESRPRATNAAAEAFATLAAEVADLRAEVAR